MGVLGPQPPLLHDDRALLVERLHRDAKRPHPVALQIDHHRERLAREVVVVGGDVVGGVGVGGPAVGLEDPVELLRSVPLRAVEHHVLEEVADPGDPGALVAGAHPEEGVVAHHRNEPVGEHPHPQPVRAGYGRRRGRGQRERSERPPAPSAAPGLLRRRQAAPDAAVGAFAGGLAALRPSPGGGLALLDAGQPLLERASRSTISPTLGAGLAAAPRGARGSCGESHPSSLPHPRLRARFLRSGATRVLFPLGCPGATIWPETSPCPAPRRLPRPGRSGPSWLARAPEAGTSRRRARSSSTGTSGWTRSRWSASTWTTRWPSTSCSSSRSWPST